MKTKDEAIKLARARVAAVEAAETMQQLQRDLEKTEAYLNHEEAKRRFDELSDIAQKAKNDLSNAALANYQETGEKEFTGGKVIMRKVRVYEDGEAIQWAIDRGLASVLKLDKRNFEKIASVELPAFFSEGEKPATRIDTTLDHLLEENDD